MIATGMHPQTKRRAHIYTIAVPIGTSELSTAIHTYRYFISDTAWVFSDLSNVEPYHTAMSKHK